MVEIENPLKPEDIGLKVGLNARYVPDLWKPRFPNNPDYYVPDTEEATLRKCQEFLDEIHTQGGEIVGIISVQVNMGLNNGLISDEDISTKQILVIKKQ